MRTAATRNRTRTLSLFVSTVLLCVLLPLCPPTKGGVAVTESSGSNEGLTSGGQVGNSSAIAAGDAAAAQFSRRHQQHAGNQKSLQNIQRFGLTLSYPPDWQLNPAVPKEGPIALNTFESHYSERGGHFPSQGAEIDISYLPKPGGSVPQIMTTDLKGSADLKIDDLPFLIGGDKAMRASYIDSFPGYITHQTEAVYLEHGSGLYKFFLTYHKGEALGPEFVADFEQILKSVRFSQ
jgi:hypothetical protein